MVFRESRRNGITDVRENMTPKTGFSGSIPTAWPFEGKNLKAVFQNLISHKKG